MDKREEGRGQLVVARGNTPEMRDAAEAALSDE